MSETPQNSPAPDPSIGYNRNLKPYRISFVEFTLAQFTGVLAILAIMVSAFGSAYKADSSLHLLAWGGVMALGIIIFAFLAIAYKKEKYVFGDDRLVSSGGTIFSDWSNEVLIKNITNVKIVRPWLEYKFFGTGTVSVDTAGTSGEEAVFKHVKNPDEILDRVLGMMKENGFSLERKKVELERKQHRVGVTLDTIGTFLGGIGFSAFLIGYLTGNKVDYFSAPMFVIYAIALSVVTWSTIVYFGNALSARYSVYEDTIVEDEYFLTSRRAIIPMENLADVTLNQGVIARIIGICNLTISCQGSGKEITYRNLAQGEPTRRRLNELIRESKKSPSKEVRKDKTERVTGAGGTAEVAESGEQRPRSRQAPGETAFECDLYMNKKRVLIGAYVMAGLALLIAGIGGAIMTAIHQEVGLMVLAFGGGAFLVAALLNWVVGMIKLRSTHYRIQSRSFLKNWSFVTNKVIEFTTEKVTGVILYRSLLDRIMGTCTVKFSSIGSRDRLEFQHITYEPGMFARILAKEGIEDTTPDLEERCHFNFTNLFKAHIFSFVVLLPLLLIGTFVVAIAPVDDASVKALILGGGWSFFGFFFGLGYILSKMYYNRARLGLYSDFIRYHCGLINLTTYYVRYEELKDIYSTKYPLTKYGKIQFDYSGEMMAQQGENQVMVSNYFLVPYLEEVEELHRLVDLVLVEKIEPGPREKMRRDGRSHPREKLRSLQPSYFHLMFETALAGIISGLAIGGFAGFMLYMVLTEVAGMTGGSGLGLVLGGGGALVFAGLVFGIGHIYVKSHEYSMEEDRVVKNWGFIYPSCKTVNFQKVDTIGRDEQFFHKMFGTVDLRVNTIGSSATELTIGRIPKDTDFYTKLQAKYKST